MSRPFRPPTPSVDVPPTSPLLATGPLCGACDDTRTVDARPCRDCRPEAHGEPRPYRRDL